MPEPLPRGERRVRAVKAAKHRPRAGLALMDRGVQPLALPLVTGETAPTGQARNGGGGSRPATQSPT
ncbi:MAG: hypothetical protein ACO3NE_00430, partial [Alphaproteobacteria bacterium]